MNKNVVYLGVRISPEAKDKIEKLAKKNLRSVAKEIERLITECKS